MSTAEVRFQTGEPPAPAPAPAPNAQTKPDGSAQFGNENPNPPAPAPESRPAWLPEKFKSPEDLAKAYSELEKSRATPPASKGDDKGFDVDALAGEYREKGSISEDTLAKMEKQGIPRNVILGYVKGQEALAAAQTAQLASAVGGEENLKNVLKWAEGNLSAPEVAGYNALIDTGNLDAAKVLLSAFAGRYTEAVGNDPNLATTNASTGAPSNSTGYASTAEMVRDMRDPRYSTDPAFRRQVREKVSRTTAF